MKILIEAQPEKYSLLNLNKKLILFLIQKDLQNNLFQLRQFLKDK
jgi:hypothetical protein